MNFTYVLRHKITGKYFRRLNQFTDRPEDTDDLTLARKYNSERYAAFAKTLFANGSEYEATPIPKARP
jgi:hypothetical protein